MSLGLPTRRKRVLRLMAVLSALVCHVAVTASLSARVAEPRLPDDARCKARDGWLYCDGQKFFVKAIGWDPTRPGQLPWEGKRPLALVERDFAAIRAAGFNTIRTWEALTPGELAVAERNGLAVLQGIWIDPAGDFADPAFRREQLAKVRRVARYSRKSPVVLAYLVMNEPAPDHLIRVGLENSRRFLRDVADAIRARDPGALVSFSSWPGLEFFDVPEFDFVAVNLYPFRPRVLVEAVGYAGMVQIWKELLAGERPLLVTEFGVSVAPMDPAVNQSGGATEDEQARELPRLADAIVRMGAAGSATFMWIDGWWKNADATGDELSHDRADGEEWFGLLAMEHLGDPMGRPRPALHAMQRWNRAVLTSPVDGQLAADAGRIEIYADEEIPDLELRVSIDGGPSVSVPTVQRVPWIRGRVLLPRACKRVRLTLFSEGQRITGWQRRLRPGSPDHLLELRVVVAERGSEAVAVLRDALGRAISGAPIRMAVSDASHRFDRFRVVTTDDMGTARLAIELPPPPAHAVVVAALREREDEPPLALAVRILGGETSQ